ncbi:MAG: carboxypeptidase-like regulatory domain-containing protein [Chthoniobacterales bacterium]
MKTFARRILSSLLLLVAATFASGAGTSALDVTVSDSAGKVAYKGKTTASGTFSTAQVAPGDYVVQFNSRGGMKGEYAVVVSAGKQKVVADVTGGKFAGGGVALRVKVGKGMNVTGQVTSGKMAASANLRPAPKGVKMKVVDGKRYFWKEPTTGSHLGGRWVEEGTPEASEITTVSQSGLENIQNRYSRPGGN